VAIPEQLYCILRACQCSLMVFTAHTMIKNRIHSNCMTWVDGWGVRFDNFCVGGIENYSINLSDKCRDLRILICSTEHATDNTALRIK
jgi:hypothetical protein